MGPTAYQKACLFGVLAAVTFLAIADLQAGWAALYALLFTGFVTATLIRLGAALVARPPEPVPSAADETLPAYTIIAPLYREAEVAPGLVAALSAIDYPRDRLQALLVLEEDDVDTLAVLALMALPAFIEVLVAPRGYPQTKPRACNVALGRARGEFVVVFDAEDRPHPQQLREAAARFAAGPKFLACLQAPLRILPDKRFIPAQFAMEYAVQFEVMLPALARLGCPFPLGGTSNHFRTAVLKKVGGWDAFNVTEDADIGFRLHARGYSLGMLRHPTFEPAPDRLVDWLPQRARWIKGHMQTFGVHTRRILAQRPSFTVALMATIGLSNLSCLFHGPAAAWILATTLHGWLAGAPLPVAARDMALLLCGWAATGAAAAVGLRRAGSPLRWRDFLLAPTYWPMLSLAAAHALHQLIHAPFHWDKTQHAPASTTASPFEAGRAFA